MVSLTEVSASAPSANSRVRILQCFTCKSMQVLPDYKGPPEHDVLLNDLVAQHGGTEGGHHAALLDVEEIHWDDMPTRRQIVDRMWAGTTGFVPEYYAARDTYKEDAAKCYTAHHRPSVATHLCSDYRNGDRRIGNPAWRDRQKLSLELHEESIRHAGPRIFLCDFCPYNMEVEKMKNEKKGIG